jgi:esterase/lipase superfamily enzyme
MPQYVDPRIPRRLGGWRSPALGLDMPIVHYGWGGQPVLLFPTAAADYLENERFWLVKAIEPLLLAGRVQVFSIDSINRLAWMDRKLHPIESARRQALYSRYVEDEVCPSSATWWVIRVRAPSPRARASAASTPPRRSSAAPTCSAASSA